MVASAWSSWSFFLPLTKNYKRADILLLIWLIVYAFDQASMLNFADDNHQLHNIRQEVPVGVPLDLSIEWYEVSKYNGMQVSQLI